MNVHLYSLIRIVHIASMAVWLVASLSAPGDVRRTLEKAKDKLSGAPLLASLAERVQRTLKISTIAGALTIASGLGLLFAHGGFAAVPPRIHAGLLLTMIALAIEVVVLGPTWARMTGLFEGDAKEGEIASAKKRFAALSGVLHLLRFATLVLMVYRF
jgi:hypothetical protein